MSATPTEATPDIRPAPGRGGAASTTGNAPAPGGSLSARIYEEVRRGIILGIYPQGSRLAEQRLAEDLNVSRVPLREAMPKLTTEGFVTTLPRRSAQVVRWSERTVAELFDVRLALEVNAAGYAARCVAGGASTEGLRAKLDASEAAVQDGDALLVATTSSDFHQAVVDLADNALLSSLMRAVSGRVTWLFYLTSQLDAQVACEEHRELLAGIQTGNDRIAEALSYAHIERGRVPSLQAVMQAVANDGAAMEQAAAADVRGA
jgi:DNA-binding GntR family transcriptional regulator